jgi:hypothetical protein
MMDNWTKIQTLTLSGVREKFLSKKSWWWKLRHSANDVEKAYRRFLFLVAENPYKTVVPWSQDLDDFWHEHILDTPKYRADCLSVFGRFIDHNPNLPKGTPKHTNASCDTRRMYHTAFDEGGNPRRRPADKVERPRPEPRDKDSYTTTSERNDASAACGGGMGIIPLIPSIMPIDDCPSASTGVSVSDCPPADSSPGPSCGSGATDGGGGGGSSCGSSCGSGCGGS